MKRIPHGLDGMVIWIWKHYHDGMVIPNWDVLGMDLKQNRAVARTHYGFVDQSKK
jgi:hypothetical protein